MKPSEEPKEVCPVCGRMLTLRFGYIRGHSVPDGKIDPKDALAGCPGTKIAAERKNAADRSPEGRR